MQIQVARPEPEEEEEEAVRPTSPLALFGLGKAKQVSATAQAQHSLVWQQQQQQAGISKHNKCCSACTLVPLAQLAASALLVWQVGRNVNQQRPSMLQVHTRAKEHQGQQQANKQRMSCMAGNMLLTTTLLPPPLLLGQG